MSESNQQHEGERGNTIDQVAELLMADDAPDEGESTEEAVHRPNDDDLVDDSEESGGIEAQESDDVDYDETDDSNELETDDDDGEMLDEDWKEDEEVRIARREEMDFMKAFEV